MTWPPDNGAASFDKIQALNYFRGKQDAGKTNKAEEGHESGLVPQDYHFWLHNGWLRP